MSAVSVGPVEYVRRWPDPEKGPWIITLVWELLDNRPECVEIGLRSDPPRGLYQSSIHKIPWAELIRKERGSEEVQDLVATARDLLRHVATGKVSDSHKRAARSPETSDGWDNASYYRALRRGGNLYSDEIRQQATQLLPAFEERSKKPGPGAPRRYGLEHWQNVAEIYTEAWTKGQETSVAVAEHFGVNTAKARKWIWRVKNEFHIPVPQGSTKQGDES